MNQRIVPITAAVLLWIAPPAFSHPGSGIVSDLAEATFQLTTIERRVFAHRSGRENKFVSEGPRNWTARFQQRLQMGLASLLKGQLGARQAAGNWTKPGPSSAVLKPLFEFSERSADSHVRKSAGTSLD